MESDNFFINHIHPTPENAKRVVGLKYNNLRRAGLSNKQAKEIADSDCKRHIDRQKRLLDNQRERYFGAFAIKSGNLLGYINFGEWTANDQLPFCNFLDRVALRAMIKHVGNTLNGEPLGIHEWVAVGDTNNRKETLDLLLERAILVAESREIYTARYDDKTALSSLGENSFQLKSEYKSFPEGFKRLFVRPFPASEYDFGYKKGLNKLFDRP